MGSGEDPSATQSPWDEIWMLAKLSSITPCCGFVKWLLVGKYFLKMKTIIRECKQRQELQNSHSRRYNFASTC